MIPLSKIFNKLWMPLLLLCLGTILASSCQLSSSPPPSSGFVVAAWPHLFTRSMKVHTPFYAVAPAPSPSESRHETRSLPSAALRPARQRTAEPGSPRRNSRPPGSLPGGLAATKQVSFSDPLVSSPSSLVPT